MCLNDGLIWLQFFQIMIKLLFGLNYNLFCVPTEGLVDSLFLANVHAKNTPPPVCTKLMSLATTLVTVKLIGMKFFFREGIWKGILFLLLYYFNPVLKYFKYFYRLNHFQGLKSPTLVMSVLDIVNE